MLAGTGQQRLAGVWLTISSLVFYCWWNPGYVLLLAANMAFNYLLGGYLLRRPSQVALVLGIMANLLLLDFYKYTGFLVQTFEQAFGLDWSMRTTARWWNTIS